MSMCRPPEVTEYLASTSSVATRRPDHHQLPRPGGADRRPRAPRARRRPQPVHRRPCREGLRRRRRDPSPWQAPPGAGPQGQTQRLAGVGCVWAFAALTASPGARAHYDRREHAGDRNAAVRRNLFNRLLGMLHHCLATRQTCAEPKAFPAPRRSPLDTIRGSDVLTSDFGPIAPDQQRGAGLHPPGPFVDRGSLHR